MQTPDQVTGSRTDLAAYAAFRARQRQQPRVRGSMRRNKYLLDFVQQKLQHGTRAKNRGSYPAHMIENCEKMRARKQRPRLIVNGATYSRAEIRLNGMLLSDVDSISYETEAHS